MQKAEQTQKTWTAVGIHCPFSGRHLTFNRYVVEWLSDERKHFLGRALRVCRAAVLHVRVKRRQHDPAEPLRGAIRAARARVPQGSPVVYLGPQGRRLEQARAAELSALPGLVLVASGYPRNGGMPGNVLLAFRAD